MGHFSVEIMRLPGQLSAEINSQQMVRGIKPFASAGFDGMAEMQGVPVDDDGGEQVEAGDAVMLPFCRTVADFALATDA